MGRGEEDGGFFDRYLQRLSLSRKIGPQQQIRKKQKRNLNLFLLSSHFQASFFKHSSYISLSSALHRSISVFFFIRVLSLYEFVIFCFFWSFPSVEEPHSDILSRSRFSVFLRISFGVSSSSSTRPLTLPATQWTRCATGFPGGGEAFPIHSVESGFPFS
jgi:hypothetical protein